MKRNLTLTLILMFIGLCVNSQNLTWTSYYAPPTTYFSQGDNLWSVTGNNLIQFDKTTGYYNRIKIPDSVFTCNAHAHLLDLNWTSTPSLSFQHGVPFIDSMSYDGQDWGTIPFQYSLINPGPTFYLTLSDSSGNYYFFSDSLGMMIYNGTNYVMWDTLNVILDSLYPGQRASGYGLLRNDPMTFDTSGNLWIALEEQGVLKFNGRNFTFFDTNAIGAHYRGLDFFIPFGMYTNLSNNYIYITTSSQNSDTAARYYYFDGTTWHSDSLPYSLGTTYIRPIIFEPNKTYFGSTKGIVAYDGISYSMVNLPSTLSTTTYFSAGSLAVDYGGRYWLMINGILTLFDGTTFTPYPDNQAVLYDNLVVDQKFDHTGNLWIGTTQSLVKKTPTGFQILPSTLGIGSYGIMAFDSSGRLWHSDWTSGTMYYYDTIDHKDTSCSLININAIAKDKNDIMWAASDVGVGMISGLTYSAVALPGISPLLRGYSCVAIDTANNVWFGIQNTLGQGGVIMYNGTTTTVLDTGNSPLPDSIQCISVDAQNRIWVGTNYYGLMVYNGTNWTIYNTSNSGIPGNNIEQIFFKNNKAYIATQDNGVGIFDGNNWQNFTRQNAPLDNDCETMVVDDSSNVWIGQECGLMKLSGLFGTRPLDRVLYGHSYQPNGSPSQHELVYLMQYDSATSVLRPVDNTYTDANGAYSFTTDLGQVYIHAVPFNDAPTGGIMPVYEDSSIIQQNAPPIPMTTATVLQNIWSTDAQALSGPATLIGTVSDMQGNRIGGLRLFLMSNGRPVATSITGMDGSFSFHGLSIGTYKIWVDKMGIDNTTAPSVNFGSANVLSASCQLTSTQLRILALGINDLDATWIKVYPNPNKGIVNISLQGTETYDITIADMMGKEMMHTTMAPGTQRIDLNQLGNGIYILRLQSGSQIYTQRIVVNK